MQNQSAHRRGLLRLPAPLAVVLAVLLLLSQTACTSTELDLFNLPVPQDGYRRTVDIAYGPLAPQRLDVYRPIGAIAAAPVVLFLHGGSWSITDKSGYRFIGQALASHGIVVMIADFRQYPEVRFPLFLSDAALAVAFAHAHAADYGGTADQLFLMGHSSGAHMAAMLGLDRRYLAAVGLTPLDLKGVIGLAGPYDFLPFTEDNVKDIFSPANADLAETQPVHFVSAAAPPFLLLQGEDDRDVNPTNSISLAAALRQAGVPVVLHLYPGMGHLGVVLDLAPMLRYRAPVLQDILAFVGRPVS